MEKVQSLFDKWNSDGVYHLYSFVRPRSSQRYFMVGKEGAMDYFPSIVDESYEDNGVFVNRLYTKSELIEALSK